MASDVVKGGWAPDEDEKLVKGIERYGTRWSLVASVVQSRNSDQCAKRWTDTLNPAIDRTTWSPDSDELLLRAVSEHGKVWTKIVKTYFPGRTGLSAKNRYNSITRFNPENPRGVRLRRKSTDSEQSSNTESVSSSSSASPSTPAISLPMMGQLPVQFTLESAQLPCDFDVSGWPPSSSMITEDSPPALSFDHRATGIQAPPRSISSPDISYQGFDLNAHQTLSAFPDESQMPYSSSPLFHHDFYKHMMSDSTHIIDHSQIYQASPQELYPSYSQPHTISEGTLVGNHFGDFDALQIQVDPITEIHWDITNSSFDPKQYVGHRIEPESSYPFLF